MKKNIPVFIISGKSPLGDPGGYPAYSYTLSQILASLAYKVHTLAIGEKKSVEQTKFIEIHTLESKLVKIIPVIKHLALAGLPYYSILFAREILRITKEKNIDSFIVWGMGPWGFSGVLLKALLPKSKKVILLSSYFTSTRHEMKGALEAIRIKDFGLLPKIRYWLVYEFVAPLFHIFEKLTLSASDMVVIHYESSRRIIKKYFNVRNKKITKFPWYNEIFTREGKALSGKKRFRHPLILSICRQDPRKGLNFLIRAIEIVRFKYPNLQCLIVGTGSFLQPNKKLVEKLRLTKWIQFPGFVADIKPILAEADIAIIVPLAQGSSALTVMEAMGYGKAVIGSDCDGIPEDITHNVNGLIVKKGNEKDLADAIERVVDTPRLQKKLGQNAYKTYKNRYGFDKMKKEIQLLLSKIP